MKNDLDYVALLLIGLLVAEALFFLAIAGIIGYVMLYL